MVQEGNFGKKARKFNNIQFLKQKRHYKTDLHILF